jgi:hypothetical protein
MRKVLITVAALMLFAMGGSSADKVTICHIPPDNPENARTIKVAPEAVQAHLGHGDAPFACEELGASPVSIYCSPVFWPFGAVQAEEGSYF